MEKSNVHNSFQNEMKKIISKIYRVNKKAKKGDIKFAGGIIKPSPEEWYFKENRKKIIDHPFWLISYNFRLREYQVNSGKKEHFAKEVDLDSPVIRVECEEMKAIPNSINYRKLNYRLTRLSNSSEYVGVDSHRCVVTREEYENILLIDSKDGIEVYNPVTNQALNLRGYKALVEFMIRLQYEERQQKMEVIKNEQFSLEKEKVEKNRVIIEDIKQIYLDENLSVVHEVKNPTQIELERIDYMNLEKILEDFKTN